MKTLHLPIKRKWFNMILNGTKKEEYREIKRHWVFRLLDFSRKTEPLVIDEIISDMRDPWCNHRSPEDIMKYFGVSFKKFDIVEFRNGYGKDVPTLRVQCNGICLSQGVKEWGALPGEYYFTILLGRIISGKG